MSVFSLFFYTKNKEQYPQKPVGTAAAAEQTDQSTAMMNTKSETGEKSESETEPETESNADEETENQLESNADEETENQSKSDADEETEEETENQSESETGLDTESEPVEDYLSEDSNEESSAEPENPDDMSFTDLTSDVLEHNWSTSWNCDKSYHWHECDDEDCPVTDNSEKDGYAKHSYGDDNVCAECGYFESNSQLTKAAEGAVPTYQEAYEAMSALKETYPEGMEWTNFTPYGSNGKLGDSYTWKGGYIYGANKGVGCAAFAFILSDAAFGSLPARAIDAI